jgi:hypothetical protein
MALFRVGEGKDIDTMTYLNYTDCDPGEQKTLTVEEGALYVVGVHNPTSGDFFSIVSGGTLIKASSGYTGVSAAYVVKATSSTLVYTSTASSGKIYSWIGKIS